MAYFAGAEEWLGDYGGEGWSVCAHGIGGCDGGIIGLTVAYLSAEIFIGDNCVRARMRGGGVLR